MPPRYQVQQHSRDNPPAVPMEIINGLVTYKPDRRASSADWNRSPVQFRRFVETGSHDVQLNCGTQRRIRSGLQLNPVLFMVNSDIPPAMGWVTVYQTPRNPGSASMPQTYGGTHKRGIDPLSYGQLYQDGPGSQPANPGGPGKIASPYFDNPMTG